MKHYSAIELGVDNIWWGNHERVIKDLIFQLTSEKATIHGKIWDNPLPDNGNNIHNFLYLAWSWQNGERKPV